MPIPPFKQQKYAQPQSALPYQQPQPQCHYPYQISPAALTANAGQWIQPGAQPDPTALYPAYGSAAPPDYYYQQQQQPAQQYYQQQVAAQSYAHLAGPYSAPSQCVAVGTQPGAVCYVGQAQEEQQYGKTGPDSAVINSAMAGAPGWQQGH